MGILSFISIYLVVSLAGIIRSANGAIVSASTLAMFVDELPNMPRVQGFAIENGHPVPNSLNIGMFQKLWKFHRDLPPSRVFAYGTSMQTATVPGPTIEAIQGVDNYITWENHLPSKHILPLDASIPTATPRTGMGIPTVVHLHGGIEDPQSDGFGNSWFTAGFQQKGSTWTTKQYHYRNAQHPGNLWYHDHSMGLTRVNLLAGLIGAYIIRNPKIENPLGLPSGYEFDRSLVVFDRSFNTDGSIYMNATGNNPFIHPQWQPEYFGDAIIVNGKAWPKMTVQRRKYRLRIINASNARFFRFFFTNGLSFVHVSADSAYLGAPVTTNDILLAPSEISDVVIDFSQSTTTEAVLFNDAAYPYPSGSPTDGFNGKVMKFVIIPSKTVDTSRVPSTLIKYPTPDLSKAVTTRYISMDEYLSSTGQPTHMYLNGKSFDVPVTETPKVGTSEVWYLINLTGDDHPLHIHLGLFVALEQRELINLDVLKACMNVTNDAIKCGIDKYAQGKLVPVPAHESGWKNGYKMRSGYMTKIFVQFSYIHSNEPYPFDATAEPGYVYHCHILDHEDNLMMRPLKFVH
ncbi:Multicopper oxidase lpr2 [Ranunculus cassubicifolius]